MDADFFKMGPSLKSGLIELYFLECLDKKKKLPKNRVIDKVSISSSVAPFKTSCLPKEIREKAEERVRNFLQVK